MANFIKLVHHVLLSVTQTRSSRPQKQMQSEQNELAAKTTMEARVNSAYLSHGGVHNPREEARAQMGGEEK